MIRLRSAEWPRVAANVLDNGMSDNWLMFISTDPYALPTEAASESALGPVNKLAAPLTATLLLRSTGGS